MQKALFQVLSVACLLSQNELATARASEVTGVGDDDQEMESNFDDESPISQSEPISMWDGIDIVVVIFFVLAAAWLLLSIIYSIILLMLLRLQAQGRLDLDDENFGRSECCNGRFAFNLGCIARRYAIRLEMTQNDDDTPRHIMTRIERRAALETILKAASIPEDMTTTSDLESGNTIGESDLVRGNEALCSICLSEYEKGDEIMTTNCAHRFHKTCVMDWLERQNNTECPVCRDTIVSEMSSGNRYG